MYSPRIPASSAPRIATSTRSRWPCGSPALSIARVQSAMQAAATGRTTILVAHRLPTARRADRIVVIDDGVVVEEGHHDDLVVAGGPYAALWESFMSGHEAPAVADLTA